MLKDSRLPLPTGRPTEARRALFLLRYSDAAASTRVRLLQYRPYLESQGWSIETQSFWDDAFLTKLYSQGKRSAVKYLQAFARRSTSLLRNRPSRFDVVVTHQDIFPWLPYLFDRVALSGANVIVDLDDATHITYQSVPWLRGKFGALLADAAEVIVGNETLAEYALSMRSDVNIIPTVVDLNRYAVDRAQLVEQELPVIGWIGTPVTSRYLFKFADVLREVHRQFPFVLRCVGVHKEFLLPGLEVERVQWSEASEVRSIQSFDIGIMPLAQEDFAKGKCGYKLIQYMACGVPALGTALGANRQIIEDSVNGLLADGPEEFGRKLRYLLQRTDERLRLGDAGRKTVEKHFSLQSQQGQFNKILERAATRSDESKVAAAYPATTC